MNNFKVGALYRILKESSWATGVGPTPDNRFARSLIILQKDSPLLCVAHYKCRVLDHRAIVVFLTNRGLIWCSTVEHRKKRDYILKMFIERII